jgi:hypothetical protein
MISTENTFDVFLVVVSLVVVSLVAFLVMSLASSFEESVFSSLKDLIIFINTHVDFEDYAMIIARFKYSKKKIKNKAVLRCDRDDKSLE